MKKIWLILGISIGLVLVNISYIGKFLENFHGNSYYSSENYTGSLDYFSHAQNNYNLANSYYKLGKFQDAIDIYNEILPKSHEVYHNSANSYYFLAHMEKISLSKRLKILKKSLGEFTKALTLKDNLATQTNKKIVETEIQELKKLLEKQTLDSKNQESETGEESDQKPTENNGDSGESSGNKESGEENVLGEKHSDSGGKGSQQEEEGLSEEEQKAIENYAQKLEKAQGEYGEYYNKVYKEHQSEFENIFGDDPFFNNDLLDKNNEKKDW